MAENQFPNRELSGPSPEQVRLIDELYDTLRALDVGIAGYADPLLTDLLGENLKALARTADCIAGARLHIRPGYRVDEGLAGQMMAADEYNSYVVNGDTTAEYISHPDLPNVMVAGLLHITGAKIKSEKVNNEKGEITRVYEGEFGGKKVYFVDFFIKCNPQSPAAEASVALFMHRTSLETWLRVGYAVE